MKHIDINCDMGEIAEDVAGGAQHALMPFLTSVNVACGGHAGNEAMMRETVAQALEFGLAIGAHPGYEDRENFGRIALTLGPETVADSVYRQVCALAAVVREQGARIAHVKPHGALYNQAAKDAALAAAIAEGVARFSRDVVLVGLAGSAMLDAFRAAGFRTAAEAFADRRYEPDGTLRPRRFADALLTDPEAAAAQALAIAREGRAETLCIHGDTPGAVRIAEAVFRTLCENGIVPRGLCNESDPHYT